MPSGGGPVYQPTTVSYEPRSGSGGGGPLGLLGGGGPALASSMGADSPLRVFRKPRPQVALLLFALISLAAGVAMLSSGWLDWLEEKEFDAAEQNESSSTAADNANSACVELPLGIILGGVFMICLGILGMGLYLKVADWRRNCVCPCPFFDKKQSLARTLQQCQNGVGCGQGNPIISNPSTDPLVSHTQYAISELPSLRGGAEDEERRNLMPNDNKECLSSAEESDRMLEPDPRIVLRPMGHHHVEDA